MLAMNACSIHQSTISVISLQQCANKFVYLHLSQSGFTVRKIQTKEYNRNKFISPPPKKKKITIILPLDVTYNQFYWNLK